MSSFLRGVLIGLLLPLAAGLPAMALCLQYFPNIPLAGTFARLLESAAPQILVAALPFILAVALLKARRLALACLTLVLVTAGFLVLQHRLATAPMAPGEQADLSLLWLNARFDNPTPPARIEAAIRDESPDIVMLGETYQLFETKESLRDLYPHQIGCLSACEVMILSKFPFELRAVHRPGIAWKERMIVVDLSLPGRSEPVTLVALHMVKPWYFGITELETRHVIEELDIHSGPLILVGDLNAAPWSQRLRYLRVRTGLTPPRIPIPSWPASAGAFGVPIDHVLVRGGPQLVSIAPWGADLGSDHRGIAAQIALP